SMFYLFFFFFFFQAEDGIRDFHVTGVQTCALPICPGSAAGPESRRGSARPSAGRRFARAAARTHSRFSSPRHRPASRRQPAAARSEERRVGKSVERGGRGSTKRKRRDEMSGVQPVY